jgi:DNA-binding winged helix-turn-helix (wHTH) protein
MDVTLLKVSGGLIVILLTIIGFWIQKWIRSTDALTQAISDLRVLLATTQGSVANLKENCDKRCLIVDGRLDDHSKDIRSLTQSVSTLKASLRHDGK